MRTVNIQDVLKRLAEFHTLEVWEWPDTGSRYKVYQFTRSSDRSERYHEDQVDEVYDKDDMIRLLHSFLGEKDLKFILRTNKGSMEFELRP